MVEGLSIFVRCKIIVDGNYRFSEEEIVVLRFDSKVLKDGILPEALHMILQS